MPDDEVQVRRRRLSHWTQVGSTYFLTFRLRAPPLVAAERMLVRHHVVGGHGRYYDLAAVVVMPDHVHLLLTPADGVTLPRVMQGVKGASARRLNDVRGTAGPVWQTESFDRIVRDADEFAQKVSYMVANPVTAGLVEDGMCYDGWWCRPDLWQPPDGLPDGPHGGQPAPILSRLKARSTEVRGALWLRSSPSARRWSASPRRGSAGWSGPPPSASRSAGPN